jgi:hypothetical protein
MVICNTQLNPRHFYPDHNNKFKSLDKLVDGTWTTVYWHSDKDKLIKQISMPGVTHKDFSHISFLTFRKRCDYTKCSIPLIFAHKFSTFIMWQSIERIYYKLNDVRYFPKIFSIDKKTYSYIQEYVPHELNKKTCPDNFQEQLKDLNNILRQRGYYIDDVHSKNFRVSNDGILKVIDCEVYNEKELKIQQFLLSKIDGSWKSKPKGNRILTWNDGRKSLSDICV